MKCRGCFTELRKDQFGIYCPNESCSSIDGVHVNNLEIRPASFSLVPNEPYQLSLSDVRDWFMFFSMYGMMIGGMLYGILWLVK